VHKPLQDPWFDYWHRRYAIHHADYANPDVFDMDRDIMISYAAQPPPLIAKEMYGISDDITLPHPAYDRTEDPLNKIGHFIFYTHGKLRDASFLDLLPSQFKCVPSKGGRHPFEAYIAASHCAFLPNGLYHYPVLDHCLRPISANESNMPQGGLYFYVTALYDRYQWRYRDSWAYKDLFLELGHLKETIRQTSEALDFALQEISIPSMLFPETPFFEECLLAYRLDICETT
jgi:SagB-type dehydrogenase family enzyme